MFERIDHVAFNVKDRAKSTKFYEDHFVFRKYNEHDVPTPGIEKIVYRKLGDTVLEIIHMPNGPSIQGLHFCIESNDFETDYDHLKKVDVPVDTEPHPTGAREPREQGWRRVVFKGPDGELIEFRG